MTPRAGPSTVPQAAAADRPIGIFTFRGAKTNVPASRIRKFGLGQPAALSATDLHRFKAHNEGAIRGLGARLSLFLRIDFTLELISVDTTTLPKFADAAPAPRHMVMFKIEPLRGIGFLDVPQPLGLVIADRMLGGKGFSVNANRPLREVEIALVNQVAMIAIKEWCTHWKSMDELRPGLLGVESNPRFLQIGPPDEIFYVLKMEAGIGDCIEQMQMVMPIKMLDPLVRQLTIDTDLMKKEKPVKELVTPRWNPAYDDIRLPVSAEWRGLEISTRDLINLKKGDIIPVKTNLLNQVEVRLAAVPKYVGRYGSAGPKCAIEITKILTSEGLR